MLLRRRSSAIVNPFCNDVDLLQSNVRYYDAHDARSTVRDSSVVENHRR